MKSQPTTIVRVETFRKDHACLVRVTDSSGAAGWGQTAPYHADITEEFLHRAVTPWVLGQDGSHIENFVNRALDRNYKFMGTFLYRAVGGVDTALWDLRGIHAGKSVCELLGGRPRAIKAYGSSMRRDTTPQAEVARMLQAHHERGFSAFKIKIGPRLGKDDDIPGAEKRTRELVPLVRKALPQHVKIFADANGSYNVEQAVRVGKWLADEGLVYFEEPCPHTDIYATAQVRAQLAGTITITAGEQDYVPALWQLMIEKHAMDVAQPDVLYNGGVCRTVAVAKLAAQAGLLVMPHAANRSMLQVFTLHLMGSLANAAEFMEYSLEETPWTDGLYSPEMRVQGGEVQFPQGPGWGITPSQQWLSTAARRVSEG